MKTKVNKIVKLAAAGLFILALAINVKVTLDDPFVMLSEDAIATGSGTGSGTGTDEFKPTSGTCTITITIKNSKGEIISTTDHDGDEISCPAGTEPCTYSCVAVL